MKQVLYYFLALILLMTGCKGHQNKWEKNVAIDSLSSILYDIMSDQPERALAFIDSLEREGIYSEGLANCRRAQVYSEQYQPRVSEVYAHRAVNDENLTKENRRYHYFAYLLLINAAQNMGNTERAMTYATQALAEAEPDTSASAQKYKPDYLEAIGCCQFALKHVDEGNKSYERAYGLYEDVVANAESFSSFYPMFMMAVDAINYNVDNDRIETAKLWLPRLEKAYDQMVGTKNIIDYVKDQATADKEITQAGLYAIAGQPKEAEAHYQAYLATNYAHTQVGQKLSVGYLEDTGKWNEMLTALEASDSFYVNNESQYSMRYLTSVLGGQFNAQKHLGHHEEALKVADKLIALLDTVNEKTRQEDAAELAVVYETQEKERKIAEQQADLTRQRLIGTAIAMVLLVVFFIIYTLHRRRAARRLAEVNAIKERIESELRIARDIQMSMVPSVFPDREGLDLYASMTPAREVGGDLYCYVLQGDILHFCVGDVSGKGVPASLFMAQVTRLFRSFAAQGKKPADICTRINQALSEDNEQVMFVTMFVGMIDLTTNHLWFCNAGHNPPVIGGGENHGEFLQMEPNAPIGLWPDLDYVGEEIENITGRAMFIYTDGLNEAENSQQEQLGDERLLTILQNTHFSNARQVIETLTAEVERHRNGAEPNDDLTMMCLRV